MTMGRTLHSEFAAFKLVLEHVHVCHPPFHSHYFIFDSILTMPRIALTPYRHLRDSQHGVTAIYHKAYI